MPQIKKQPKKANKSDSISEKLEQAVTFLLDELDSLKDKVDKIVGRLGL